jgi:predicted Zn finger-like uncharacterized protein
MLIVCPSCQTSYDVAADSLGEAGRSVRCVRCLEVWFATPAAGDNAPIVNAAAASAQYQRGAATSQNAPGSGFAAGAPSADEDTVDPNLAARAAGLSHVAFDDPSLGAGARAARMDETDSVVAYDAPPLAPEDETPAQVRPVVGAEPAEDIETVAARRARREMNERGRRGRRPSVGVVIALLLAVNASLLGWRSDVVRAMPQTASLFAAIGLPVNLRGLAFTDVKTTKEMHDGVPVLLVQGTISNVARQPREVARLRFSMRNGAGREIYTWTTLPARSVLAPGDSLPFQTRLASPPTEGREVVVRFFNRHDAIAGMH